MGRTKRERNRKVSLVIDENSQCDIINLKKWMRLKNSHFKVISFENAGRGVISPYEINSGDELIAVPLRCMITISDLKTSLISHLLERFCDKSHVALAMFILYENHLSDASKYVDYIKVLPTVYETLLYSPDYEIKTLPRWIRVLVESTLTDVKQNFDDIQSNLPDESCLHCCAKIKDIFNFNNFLWGWSTVNTRGVYFKDDGPPAQAVGNLALAPFIDFFNHSNDADVEVQLNCQKGVYSLKTNKPFKKYEQIFIKYGAHPNLKLLVEYGFILDDDMSQDCVEFTFDEVLLAVRKTQAHFAEITKMKYKFIKANDLNTGLSKSQDEFSWNLNGLLYILVTQDSDLVQLLSKTYSSTWSDKEASVMDDVKERLVQQKIAELKEQLLLMNRLEFSTSVFKAAIKLVEMYIRILET